MKFWHAIHIIEIAVQLPFGNQAGLRKYIFLLLWPSLFGAMDYQFTPCARQQFATQYQCLIPQILSFAWITARLADC